MPICPAGHQTSQTDFCDTCGLPIPAQAPATVVAVSPEPAAVQSSEPVICPNCHTPNVADALFCEACGYDFTTGSMPLPPQQGEATPAEPDAEPSEPEPAPAAGEIGSAEPGAPAAHPDAAAAELDASVAGLDAPPSGVDAPLAQVAGGQASELAPVAPQRPSVEWVAELWIDPDWYAAQGSSDPMPSPAMPDIVPLVKESNLIGRVSNSRGIFPDVDCELDTGCSRRHAMLSTDGTRWWIEDLDSANGTFVGGAAGPLPAMPIPRGRVELNPGQRIYVGAWTRIVIRRATEDEKEAFAG